MPIISDSDIEKARQKMMEVHSALHYLQNRTALVATAIDLLTSEGLVERFTDAHTPNDLSKEYGELIIKDTDKALHKMVETITEAFDALHELRKILNASELSSPNFPPSPQDGL